jgi:hypothetical protein
MSSCSSNVNNICSRLTALKVPLEVKDQVLAEIQKLIRNNGEEYTVTRLKALKQAWLSKLAGTKVSFPWIRHHSDDTPVGAFRWFFRSGQMSKKHLKRSFAALLMYTNFTAINMTATQKKKFQDAVTEPSKAKALSDSYYALSLGKPGFWDFKRDVSEPQSARMYKYLTSSKKRMPVFENSRIVTVPESSGSLKDALALILINDSGYRAIQRYWWLIPEELRTAPGLFSGLFTSNGRLIWEGTQPNLWFRTSATSDRTKYGQITLKEDNLIMMGTLGSSQEPGYKLRVFANPNRIWQIMLDPLQNVIMNYLRRIGNDYTYDQKAGAQRIQRLMQSQGTYFAAYDLSNATDRLPLQNQLDVLYYTFPNFHQFIDLFSDLSKNGIWDTRRKMDIPLVSWRVGQPLGLGPSFGSFALYHHSIIRTCAHLAGVTVDDDLYMIVGDDVVITNKLVAARYEQAIEELGVSISKSKSIISSRVTEFVGHLIMEDQIVPTVKYRKISDRNFLDVVKAFGMSIIPELQPNQRKVAEVLSSLPEPYGLGFNPLGLSLKLRQGMINDVNNFLGRGLLPPSSEEQATRFELRPRDLFHPTWEGELDSVPIDLSIGYTVRSKRKVDKTLRKVSPFLEQLKNVDGSLILANVRDILLQATDVTWDEKINIYERLTSEYTLSHIDNDPRGNSQLHRYQQILHKDEKAEFMLKL